MLPFPILADATLRMLIALLIGYAIGLDRDLHDKPTGIKTLGLVSLGACIATMCAMDFSAESVFDHTDVSRVMQGIVTGIGFFWARASSSRIRARTTCVD